jgi:hypothetical protein
MLTSRVEVTSLDPSECILIGSLLVKRFYPITVHSGCRGYNVCIRYCGYNVGNQLSVEWQRPVTILLQCHYKVRPEEAIFRRHLCEGTSIVIYINKNVNVRLFKVLNLRKFFTDCFEILIQRCIRICACFYIPILYM